MDGSRYNWWQKVGTVEDSVHFIRDPTKKNFEKKGCFKKLKLI